MCQNIGNVIFSGNFRFDLRMFIFDLETYNNVAQRTVDYRSILRVYIRFLDLCL